MGFEGKDPGFRVHAVSSSSHFRNKHGFLSPRSDSFPNDKNLEKFLNFLCLSFCSYILSVTWNFLAVCIHKLTKEFFLMIYYFIKLLLGVSIGITFVKCQITPVLKSSDELAIVHYYHFLNCCQNSKQDSGSKLFKDIPNNVEIMSTLPSCHTAC